MTARGLFPILLLALLFVLVFGCDIEDEEEKKKSSGHSVILADDPFLQEQARHFLFEGIPKGFNPENITRPFYAVQAIENGAYAGGPEGIFLIESSKPENIFDEDTIYSLYYHHGMDKVLAGGTNALYIIGQEISSVDVPEAGSINDIYHFDDVIWLGTEHGIYAGGLDGFSHHDYAGDVFVRDIAVCTCETTVAATSNGLIIAKAGLTDLWNSSNYLPSDDVYAVEVDSADNVWIGTNKGIVYRARATGEFSYFGGEQGLPYEIVTSFSLAPDTELPWMGTTWGVIRKTEAGWDYFAGQRWLQHNYVNDISAVQDSRDTWIATNNGVTRIRNLWRTMNEKAEIYEQGIRARHDRLTGLVSECDLVYPGDLDLFIQKDSDNDGLWTGMYLASLSFKYAVTGDENVRQLADRHFDAMATLEGVTGIPGLIARSVVPYGEKSLDPECHPYCQWQGNKDMDLDWKSDASSDEMTGHFYAYAIYYDLAAQGEQREKLIKLVHRIASYLVDNDYYLIDWDGRPTKWGIWNPRALYNWWNYRDAEDDPGRLVGLVYANSLEILSFMRTAYHITGDVKFLDAYYDLANNWGLADMMINAAVNFLGVTNHSTDELLFLAYYPLLRYEDDPVLRLKYLDSLHRSFEANRIENSSFFNITYGALVKGGEDFGLDAAVTNLRDIPLDLVTWTMQNSQRADIITNALGELIDGQPVSDYNLPPVPMDERRTMKWNRDPFVLDGGNGGYSEEAGTFYLLPYWMGRYHGFITGPAN